MVKVLLWQKLHAGDVAQRAGLLALVDAAEGLRVVFDHAELVPLGKGADAVHVADVAVEVDRHDGLGALVDQLLGGLDADAVVVEVHVGKARDGAGLHDGETAGDEGVAGHDHLVARPDPQRRQADVERRRPVGHAHGVLAALPRGELLLELHALAPGPVIDLAGAKHILHGVDCRFVERGPMGQLIADGPGAAVNRQPLRRTLVSFLARDPGAPANCLC